MDLKEIINRFSEQLSYEPKIENSEAFVPKDKFIVCGMGGSNLAAEIIKIYQPEIDIIVHKDFGLPSIPDSELGSRLVILSSYSGQTQETIDAFNSAQSSKFSLIVISGGGELLKLAKDNGVPFIQLPVSDGVQPRLAIGLSLKATLKAMEMEDALSDISKLTGHLNPADYESQGHDLADKLKAKVPVAYSSVRNSGLAYIWKVNFNETAKTPLFYNVFPELNHNEMLGFSGGDVLKNAHFIFLKDSQDDQRIELRMDLTKKLLEDRGFAVEVLDLEGDSIWQKVLGSILLAQWSSYYLAQNRGIDPSDLSMLEDFKKATK